MASPPESAARYGESESPRPRNPPSGIKGGMRSQNILKAASNGTAIRMPGTPHNQPQRSSARKMTTGLRVRRRPSASGVRNCHSSVVRNRKAAGGSKADAEQSDRQSVRKGKE